MYDDFRSASNGPAALASPLPASRPDFAKIGILNDYVRIPYAAGSSFAAQLLHEQFTRRGHDVTLIGPRDPTAAPSELPEDTVLFPGIPVKCQPGFFLPLPTVEGLRALASRRFDVLLGQTGSGLMDAGVWLRVTQQIPLVCVNTSLLAALYDVLLPETLSANPVVQRFCKNHLVPMAERAAVEVYNQSDGLVVLSRGLEQYWRDLGVRVPIHIIPRSINPNVVRSRVGPDPYDPRAPKGSRVVVLCRHVREKGLARLLDIFAAHIAPQVPEATFTLVGDGADHDAFKMRAARLGIADRCFWPGEFSVTDVRSWYAHGDVFVYASMSETYGQVVSEAMYCGLPVVAFDDGAGVAQQVKHGVDGLLLPPGPGVEAANARFGAEVVELVSDPGRRRFYAEAARASARRRVDPERVIAMYYSAFEQARRHRSQAQVDPSVLERVQPLARWTALHTFVGALSMLRPATVLNRHGRSQPTWSRTAAHEPPPDATREPRAVDGVAA